MEGLPRAKRGTARLSERADLLRAVTADRRQGSRHHAGGDLVADQDQGTDPRMDSRLRCAHRQGALDVPDRFRRKASSAATPGQDGSNEYAGKVTVWTMMSADEELGHVYLPTNTTAPDFYGAHRLGDNLFAESVVALDVNTGKRVWHFQTVHHGLWDYDNPAAPNLLDITVNGDAHQGARADHQAGLRLHVRSRHRKTGVADRREAGAAVGCAWREGVADAADSVEAGAVRIPGRRPSNDLADFTPEIRAMAEKAIQGFRTGPLFTPPSLEGTHRRGRARPAARTGAARPSIRRRACSTCRRATRYAVMQAEPARRGARQQPALHADAGPQSADARGTAAVQAAVLAHDGDRHEHRQSRVDGARPAPAIASATTRA